jgi:hypothetical protein
MNIEISVVIYEEGDKWIAQGLEFDIVAQADSLPDLAKKFAVKAASEVAISVDLGREIFSGIDPAPEKFWRMYSGAKIKLQVEEEPILISNRPIGPRIVPVMRVASSSAINQVA